ncbi:TetR/AcrR family transcriptional regulator [Pseudactinotalea terrae]|uniref:TetR/AcrR family transcriptional regulator n=1 Tax=Pseudactinotalea terrae TaxID=1743262 RepID=UPI0012E13C9E|nr:TetR/AcrR family transcriptional regulator [Pseudactinotalea terrae]
MTEKGVRARIVEAADRLFYGHGIGRVGMDAVRDEAGASLKAIYREFSSKEDLVLAVLEHRHQLWTAGLESAMVGLTEPRERLLAVYDYLASWFDEADFRGCGFINAFAELGADSPRIAAAVRDHKASFQRYVDAQVVEIGAAPSLGPQLAILAEGAQTSAAIAGAPDAAMSARAAAEVLIDAAMAGQADRG